MPKALPVIAKEEADTPLPVEQGRSLGIWVEAISVPLGITCLWKNKAIGFESISSVEKGFFVGCVLFGIFVALIRANRYGQISFGRLILSVLLWLMSGCLIAFSFALSQPLLAGLGLGLVLASWCNLRIAGEGFAFALSLGLALCSPSLLELFHRSEAEAWLSSMASLFTSGLSDAAGLSHIREEQSIFFGHGIAERFECMTSLDSAVSFLGFAILLTLAMRRNLIPGGLTLILSVVIWVLVRATFLTSMAYLSVGNGVLMDWTPMTIALAFATGLILTWSVNQFLAIVFEPIPLEFINLDFPLFALGWNWICGLPRMWLIIPQRQTDFGPMDVDGEADLA